jgi:hypothetical protein
LLFLGRLEDRLHLFSVAIHLEAYTCRKWQH